MDSSPEIVYDKELEKLIAEAQKEKSKAEDEALRQKMVTYVQFEDLEDFAPEHQFFTDFDQYVNQGLQENIRDPEEWHAQF